MDIVEFHAQTDHDMDDYQLPLSRLTPRYRNRGVVQVGDTVYRFNHRGVRTMPDAVVVEVWTKTAIAVPK